MIWSSILPSFLASIVEFVEALTIVLVVGVTVNWKSSLLGAGVAMLTLAALVATFGSTLVFFIPIDVLRLIIGIILVLFGLQWLKKALLRYSGLKALHDEAAIYEEEMMELSSRGTDHNGKFNGFGFATSYKSVLLEGLEVAFIVITFGASAATNKIDGITAAAIGALLAFLVVVSLGIAIRRPLTKIPENTLKFTVGIMLVTFGTFWAGEGLGVNWPFADLFLLVLVTFYLILSVIIVRWLRSSGFTQNQRQQKSEVIRNANWITRMLNEVFNFFCGDWRLFYGVSITIVLVQLTEHLSLPSFASWVGGIVFIMGVATSTIVALKREVME